MTRRSKLIGCWPPGSEWVACSSGTSCWEYTRHEIAVKERQPLDRRVSVFVTRRSSRVACTRARNHLSTTYVGLPEWHSTCFLTAQSTPCLVPVLNGDGHERVRNSRHRHSRGSTGPGQDDPRRRQHAARVDRGGCTA